MLELPTDFMRPPIQRYMGDRISFTIEEDLYNEVIKLDNKYNVTPFMFFIAAFELLLFKYSGQTDLCIGTPVAGRNINELENLIGFFANTVVLRGDLSANPQFIELLKRTYDTTVEALSNQDIPFEKLVDLLQPSRNMSYTPLFQVMLSYNRANPQRLDLDGLKLTPLRAKSKVSKFDLSVEVLDKSSVFKIDFEYNTDLYKESTIKQMISHFQNMLKQVVQSPEKRISEIEILSNEEYETITRKWNYGEIRPSYEMTFPELFEIQAASTPLLPAVMTSGQGTLTYDELNKRANKLAHYLIKKGASAEKFVAVCMNRSQEMLIAIVAILKTGAAYVPIDPAYPKERIKVS
jgi:non-ribosomal peptide synthetase component F